MIVGTAGHIDHGKSALVEALTGVHPDRLPEEQRRGMTLDLGFGHWMRNGEPVGVVDVPGHERLVRTMVAGAWGMDAVLFVVDAAAGVQPQTIEHFQICTLLGLPQAVVALTKCDLAGPAQIVAAREQVHRLLAGSGWETAPVLEVSALTGAGVAPLRAALEQAAAAAPARDLASPLRLPVDRVFTMKGFGTVVTGTLLAGSLRLQEEIAVEPGGLCLRVRGLQVHGRAVDCARAGERTAVNLAGAEAKALTRGQVLIAPGSAVPSAAVSAALRPLPGIAIRHRSRVRLHAHTAECLAEVRWPDAAQPARLHLEQPQLLAAGDRFILRQLSPARTLAGGAILDPHPPVPARRTRTQSAPVVNTAPPIAPDAALRTEVAARVQAAGLAAPALPGLLAGLPPEARAALATLVRGNVVVEPLPGWFVHTAAIADLRRRLPPHFSVAEFKDLTGLSRRLAIPLLEHLDRQRITRRVGELRELV